MPPRKYIELVGHREGDPVLIDVGDIIAVSPGGPGLAVIDREHGHPLIVQGTTRDVIEMMRTGGTT